MATVGLFAAGLALAPAGGGFIIGSLTYAALYGAVGAAIGGFIDNTFLFPAIFGGPGMDQDIQGPRLDELKLQTGSEGSAMKMLWGNNNRIAGTVIWVSDLIEEVIEETEEVGGKGGPGGASVSTTHYNYFTHIAVAVCEGPLNDDSLSDNGFFKIYGDEKCVYLYSDAAPPFDETYNGFTVSDQNIDGEGHMVIESPNGGPDMTLVPIGSKVRTSGFAETGNNTPYTGGTGRGYVCNRVEDLGGGVTNCWLRNPEATAEGPGAEAHVREIVFAFNLGDSITFYPGSTTQNPDPIIEAEEGAGEVPAHRGVAYFVIEKLYLGEFGNRIPNFTVMPYQHDTTVSDDAPQDDVFESILTRAGFIAAEFDLDLSSRKVFGYIVSGPQQTVKQLEPLMLAYDVMMRESGTELKFFQRGDEDEHTVDEDDVGAGEFGDKSGPRPILLTDVSSMDLPSKVNVTFTDRARVNQDGAVQARRIDYLTDGNANVNLPMTFPVSWARQLGERLLWQAWQERQRASVTLPPSYLTLEETDIVHYPYNGETYSIRGERISRGANYLFEVKGAVQDVETFISEIEVPDNPLVDPDPYLPPETTLIIMMLPPLSGLHVNVPGYYYAICASDAADEWLGATIYISTDDSEWSLLAGVSAETKIGIAKCELCPSTLGHGSPFIWDRLNTLDVEMYHGELSSAATEQVLNGTANAMLVGDEIIGFANATLLGTNPVTGAKRYRISKLLRGRRNTQDAHDTEETVVLLESGLVRFADHAIGSVGTDRYWRGVSRNGEIADFDSVQDELEAKTIQPWHVIHVRAVRDGNDVVINWVRRTRNLYRLFSNAPTPLEEPMEQYELDYYDADDNFLRTEIINDATTATYTEAEQDADVFTHGDPLLVKIYQMSALIGRGEEGGVFLPKAGGGFDSGFSSGFDWA